MQKIFRRQFYLSICSFMLLVFLQAVAMAQDSAVSSSTTTTTTSSATTSIQPWMWVVGGAVLLIIIIAMLRGNKTDKTVITKEHIRD